MKFSSVKVLLLSLSFLHLGQLQAKDCIFSLREIITAQDTDQVDVKFSMPTFPKNGAVRALFSSGKSNQLIDDAKDINHFFRNVSEALEASSIESSYLFTPGKLDDQGLSKALKSPSTKKYKMENGLNLYLLKTNRGEVHLYTEVKNSFSGAVEVHKVGGAKFGRRLGKLEDRNLVHLTEIDSTVIGRTLNIDDYGTEGVVDIANDYILTYKQLSGWSFSNSDRIDIVKSAYRYALDLQRSGKARAGVNTRKYVQDAIDRVKDINGQSSWITAENATDLVYESLSMNIPAELMIQIYKRTTKKVAGDRYYYMTFLNSMFSNIKIRNLKGENIQITDGNWEKIFDEYLEQYKKATKEAGFWGDSMAPMMFSYSMLKNGDYDKNMLHAKELIIAINKVIGDTKISGAVLLLARGMKIDGDMEQVKQLAETIKMVYRKTSHDKGGSILMGEVAQREGLTVERMKEEYSYLYKNASLGSSTTIGEAIYVGRKMDMTFNEIMHSMNELQGRLYSKSSLDSQGVVDLLESLRLKRQLIEGAEQSSDAAEAVDEKVIMNTIDDVIEEVADDTLNTVLMAAIVINVAT